MKSQTLSRSHQTTNARPTFIQLHATQEMNTQKQQGLQNLQSSNLKTHGNDKIIGSRGKNLGERLDFSDREIHIIASECEDQIHQRQPGNMIPLAINSLPRSLVFVISSR